jgi:hypothetical protein
MIFQYKNKPSNHKFSNSYVYSFKIKYFDYSFKKLFIYLFAENVIFNGSIGSKVLHDCYVFIQILYN